MPTKLSVNVNKLATLRNTRPQLNIPDVIYLSAIAIRAGAEGLTIHPRPDQRHIRDDDVMALAELVQQFPKLEFNIEGNPFEGRYLDHCRAVKPDQCTLVPDTVWQRTSDHGWRFPEDFQRLQSVVCELQKIGCRVSLFMDPIAEQMTWVKKLGAERVELYTEPYAAKFSRGDPTAAADYARAAEVASAEGLAINAGHDLNRHNLRYFLQQVNQVVEVSIGHALIADAIEFGLAETVRLYRNEIQKAVGQAI